MISGFTAPRNISAVRLIVSSLGLQGFLLVLAKRMNRDRIHFLRQNFARQGQIDRTLRVAERHLQRAIDDGLHLIAIAQLIVPARKLAQQAALIERFLAPVDEIGCDCRSFPPP